MSAEGVFVYPQLRQQHAPRGCVFQGDSIEEAPPFRPRSSGNGLHVSKELLHIGRLQVDVSHQYDHLGFLPLREHFRLGDCENELALNVPVLRSFVRFSRFCERKHAVDDNAKDTCIQQTPDFRQLCAARLNLGC